MMKVSFKVCGAVVVAFSVASAPVVSSAAVSAEAKCEAGKNDAAGKYASCIAKAEKLFVTTEDLSKYGASIAKCEAKQLASWGKLEAAAVAASTTCPTTGDQESIAGFVDACVASVALALQDGGTVPLDVITCNEDLDTCNAELGTCNSDLAAANSALGVCGTDLATTNADLAACEAVPDALPLKTGLQICYAPSGAETPCDSTEQDGETQLGVARTFVDNNDGTITDTATGLMWEKLSNDGTIHDKDTSYSWGNAFATKIATLNTEGFAGHTDWRLPNVFELQTLVNYGVDTPATYTDFKSACPASCTVTTCSCTAADWYWTSTTYVANSPYKWAINFISGEVNQLGQSGSPSHVRAVRTL